jgi:LacI family transcriptional regulator
MSTIHDIARQVGVTPMTVSRVLSGSYKAKRPDAVRRATVIRQVAQDMGYRVNTSARTMRNGRFGSVALLMSRDASRSVLHETELYCLHDALDAMGFKLVLTVIDDEQLQSDTELPLVLQENSVDGMLINYKKCVPDRLHHLIRMHHLPAVWMARKLESDAVYYEYQKSVCDATKQLINMGHQRICLAHVFEENPIYEAHYSQHDPVTGYLQAMSDHDLNPMVKNIPSGRQAFEWIKQLFENKDRPTAFITRRHTLMYQVISYTCQQGISIPDDLHLLLIGHPMNDTMGVPVSMLKHDSKELAQKAVQAIVAKIAQPDQPLPSNPVALQWISPQ